MFSPGALDDFLTRNGLSHVIRAHEVKEAGFQVNYIKCEVFLNGPHFNEIHE